MVVLIALEELASSAFVDWLELPGWTGGVAAGVVVGLGFGRLQRWMEGQFGSGG